MDVSCHGNGNKSSQMYKHMGKKCDVSSHLGACFHYFKFSFIYMVTRYRMTVICLK